MAFGSPWPPPGDMQCAGCSRRQPRGQVDITLRLEELVARNRDRGGRPLLVTVRGRVEVNVLKQTLLVVALASLLAFVVALPAGAGTSAPLAGQWNRLSVDQSHPAPEHELLYCAQFNSDEAVSTANSWFCSYHKRREPTLNLYWHDNHGVMSGKDITATWTCPSQFPPVCSDVVQVVEGTFTYFQFSSGQPPSQVLEDLVVTQTSSGQRLYVYFVNRFVCPWFRTFGEALAANPLPLPFNGTWPPQDCTLAG